jgi:hypothetical protein
MIFPPPSLADNDSSAAVEFVRCGRSVKFITILRRPASSTVLMDCDSTRPDFAIATFSSMFGPDACQGEDPRIVRWLALPMGQSPRFSNRPFTTKHEHFEETALRSPQLNVAPPQRAPSHQMHRPVILWLWVRGASDPDETCLAEKAGS